MKAFLLFAMLMIGAFVATVTIANAQTTEQCTAEGVTLSEAITAFETECGVDYNKDLGHDCDPGGPGWICTGMVPVEPDPEPEPTMVPVCAETGSTLVIAESRWDEACQMFRECTLQPDGKTLCEGYFIHNAIAPEPDPEPELPVNPLKPTLVDPLVVNLTVGNNNPDIIDANGQDVLLVWPDGIVTDDAIEIREARHIHSIGGDFRPAGDSNVNAALKIQQGKTGGVTYLERMYIDISGRRYQNDFMHSDPDTIQSVDNTGDAIMFGGQVPYNANLQTTYPSFVMEKSIILGVSGQDPQGCTTCGGAHADGFETVGPTDKVTFKDIYVESNYQGIFVAPAKNFYGEYLDPDEQNLNGVDLQNVTAVVIEPAGLSSTDQTKWRFRATGFYMEGHNLRVENRQSCWVIDILGDGKLYLDTPTTETQDWLNFIGGKTVLHTVTSDPDIAVFDFNGPTCNYVPDANDRLIHGVSPTRPMPNEVGPNSPEIYQ